MPEGFPVVIVESGGTPFVAVEDNAPLATVATNGWGIPITVVESGAPPLIIDGYTPPEPDEP